ncbi:hypothetical protein GCM10010156_78360 [Planobispora rosea]|nr:hypothetical protein GCM10010156_78360 [Planobispora rosea]
MLAVAAPMFGSGDVHVVQEHSGGSGPEIDAQVNLSDLNSVQSVGTVPVGCGAQPVA